MAAIERLLGEGGVWAGSRRGGPRMEIGGESNTYKGPQVAGVRVFVGVRELRKGASPAGPD